MQVVVAGRLAPGHVLGHRAGCPLLLAQATGYPGGDAVQPTAQGGAVADRPGTLDQHQKGGLSRVVDVRGRAEPTPTGGPHGRGVAHQKHFEGVFIPIVQEAGQQLRV